ncbi:hypothetical protein EMIHUDRAFT_60043, partial [Emiliania huxleyi CCMP1516]|uniref:Histone H4 n=2 Tax=Emiliania huxleyi TaxID=2903 RepID=A0A0D3KEE1_EMIH1
AFGALGARAGVLKLSGGVDDELRSVTKVFLENLVRNAVTCTEHERSREVTPAHVLKALQQ